MTDAPLIENHAMARMRAGDVALGMIVRITRSGEIAALAKTSGHDFIFIDGQHGLFDLESIAAIAQAARAAGITPLVRARSVDDPDVPRLLDNGVAGIIFPDVETAEEARRAVALAKFAPLGRRSVSAGYPVFDFRAVPQGAAISALNASTLVVCMVETREGVANADAIAAVPGVDVVHIGCNDLLVDMGKPGAFGDPEVMDAVHQVIKACKQHGKWAGLGGDKDIGRQGQLIAAGIRFITVQSEVALILAEGTRRVSELRQAAAAVPAFQPA